MRVDLVNHLSAKLPPAAPTDLPTLVYRRPGNKVAKTPTVVVPYNIKDPVDHALMVLSRSVGKM